MRNMKVGYPKWLQIKHRKEILNFLPHRIAGILLHCIVTYQAISYRINSHDACPVLIELFYNSTYGSTESHSTELVK